MLGVTTSGAAEEGLRHVVTCFVRRVARGLSRREGSRRDARRGPASARASVRSPVVAGDVRRAAARRCPHASAHRGRHTHHVPDALRTCDGDARADRRVVRVARLARTSPWASVETCCRGGKATGRRGQAAAAVSTVVAGGGPAWLGHPPVIRPRRSGRSAVASRGGLPARRARDRRGGRYGGCERSGWRGRCDWCSGSSRGWWGGRLDGLEGLDLIDLVDWLDGKYAVL